MASAGESYVHPTAVVDEGAELHEGVTVWHFCHIRKNAVLEPGVSIGRDVYIDEGVRIGRGSRVQNGVSVFSGVEVAPWCFIGPHVIFTNDALPRVGKKSWELVTTHLETGMSIGAGAIIRCGINLGAFSMVGAGAIVTKSVPPFHMAAGFPAECRQMLCACGETFLPIASGPDELLRDCCREQLVEGVYRAAEDCVARMKPDAVQPRES